MSMSTQSIPREPTFEEKIRTMEAMFSLALERLISLGDKCEFTPLEVAQRMMYPKETSVELRPSDGMVRARVME